MRDPRLFLSKGRSRHSQENVSGQDIRIRTSNCKKQLAHEQVPPCLFKMQRDSWLANELQKRKQAGFQVVYWHNYEENR